MSLLPHIPQGGLEEGEAEAEDGALQLEGSAVLGIDGETGGVEPI